MHDIDDYLMQQFLNGDRNAFKHIVDRHKHEIFRFILYKVKDRDLASDLTQDVFVKLFKSANRYLPSGKFRAWLFRIAQNICIDEQRRNKKASILSLTDTINSESNSDPILLNQLEDQSANPSREVELAELQNIINHSLDVLPEKQRIAFVLCQYDGLSYQEIAAIQKCAVGTVKSRIHTALTKIRDFLKENEML